MSQCLLEGVSPLVRLIEGKPLTPINDTDDVWNDVTLKDEKERQYQCKRMSSLFKYVYADGTVKYTDVDRYYCKDINTGNTYRFGFVGNLIEELFPITMPYIPEDKSIIAFCEDFLFDQESGGDFDTFAILYLRDPHGNNITVNKFFKEGNDGLVEITEEEYNQRKANAVKKDEEK